ncbi:helix-turn-helix domain-containing protein [Pedobacter sp. ASV28]|uniref:helix-turn-helix domain-containing protein n=1 Tax=Pedobacter sp. ASV28 TaxID=2795123 RepID=UPI0018EAED84|nr:helix-turn-helix domain-containing protein [Pedobacter sp. ASV28]
MNYQVFEPHPNLSSYVKCYWSLESLKTENPQRQIIIPDGCMEMVFHYGDLYRQYISSGKSIIQPRCFVIGQLTQPLEIEPTGQTGIFSVRFHPEGFTPFASLSIREMENRAIDLEKLFGADGLEIDKRILSANSTAARIQAIETFLTARLTTSESIDRMVKSTVDTILTANGQLSINELSAQANINRRQLERKFAAHIGLSPKQLSKIIRLQATLKLLLDNKSSKLTTLAYQGEYYDQAHFIKDFKEFTGQTPKEFYGDKLKMSALFYNVE